MNGKGQEVSVLRKCIETGLEKNYAIRIVKNEQQSKCQQCHSGNAGYLPALDLTGGYSGVNNNTRSTLTDGTIEKSNGVSTETANAGLSLNWTVFDGFGIQATYTKLKEFAANGGMNTRMTIEDFV